MPLARQIKRFVLLVICTKETDEHDADRYKTLRPCDRWPTTKAVGEKNSRSSWCCLSPTLPLRHRSLLQLSRLQELPQQGSLNWTASESRSESFPTSAGK